MWYWEIGSRKKSAHVVMKKVNAAWSRHSTPISEKAKWLHNSVDQRFSTRSSGGLMEGIFLGVRRAANGLAQFKKKSQHDLGCIHGFFFLMMGPQLFWSQRGDPRPKNETLTPLQQIITSNTSPTSPPQKKHNHPPPPTRQRIWEGVGQGRVVCWGGVGEYTGRKWWPLPWVRERVCLCACVSALTFSRSSLLSPGATSWKMRLSTQPPNRWQTGR